MIGVVMIEVLSRMRIVIGSLRVSTAGLWLIALGFAVEAEIPGALSSPCVALQIQAKPEWRLYVCHSGLFAQCTRHCERALDAVEHGLKRILQHKAVTHQQCRPCLKSLRQWTPRSNVVEIDAWQATQHQVCNIARHGIVSTWRTKPEQP